MSALIGRTGISFLLLDFQKEKRNKRGKETRGGFPRRRGSRLTSGSRPYRRRLTSPSKYSGSGAGVGRPLPAGPQPGGVLFRPQAQASLLLSPSGNGPMGAPLPSGLPLKTTTQGRASPYVENPRECPQEGCCGEWDIPTHAVFLLYGPDTWPARVSNSSKAFNQRCRGRLSRRPADIPMHYCRGQRPARPIHRITKHLSLDAVGAASLGRPIFK